MRLPSPTSTPSLRSASSWLASAALASLLWSGPASAAQNYYDLKIDNIQGSSTDPGHANWIDVDSWSWGLTRAATPASVPVFQDFAWTQNVDASTVPIFLGVANGTHYLDAELDVTKAGGDQFLYFEMIFGFVTLTSLDVADGSVVPTASASLGYQQVTMRYRSQIAGGLAGPWIEGTFSLVNNAVVFSGDANVLTGLFESGGSVSLEEVAVAPVPEPGSWALMFGGLGVLGWRTRRLHPSPRIRSGLCRLGRVAC